MTTFTGYIEQKIAEHAQGRTLRVLDMGCGKGTVIASLLNTGHAFYGYDFDDERRRGAARQALEPYFNGAFDEHIRVMTDERKIPFDDNEFDLIYAIQVFEHVRLLSDMLAECARVLKPGGKLIATFPLATAPIEQHVYIPFAHWLPPGEFRVRYLWLWYLFRRKNGSAIKNARRYDAWLADRTYYRFLNEFISTGSYFFEAVEIDTRATVRSRLEQGNSAVSRMLLRLDWSVLYSFIGHFVNITIVFNSPRQQSD